MSRFFTSRSQQEKPVEEFEMLTPDEQVAARKEQEIIKLTAVLTEKGYMINLPKWRMSGFDFDCVPFLPPRNFIENMFVYAAMHYGRTD